MPQMSPLSWLTLYMMFTITLIIFCIVNYYIYTPSNPKSLDIKKMDYKTFNWKW